MSSTPSPNGIKDEGASLYLEERLKALSTGRLGCLHDDYENIRKAMVGKQDEPGEFTRVESYYKFLKLVNRNGSDHFREIVELIGKIVEPLEQRLDLSAEEIYVLLSAVYLHDVAKVFPNLIDPNFNPINGITPNEMKMLRAIEEEHAHYAFQIVSCFIKPLG